MLKILIKIILISFLITHCASCAYSKNEELIDYRPQLSFSLKNASINKLSGNVEALYPFFKQLAVLRNKKDTATVNIVHLGDSHIQADFLTSAVRNLFQRYFGNAGFGLIAPHKLTKSNESHNYKITSTSTWDYSKCIKPNTIPIGITGLGLSCANSQTKVNIETFNPNTAFNQVIVYYNHEICRVVSNPENPCKSDSICSFAEKIQWEGLANSTELDFFSSQNEISIYGFDLRNGNPGILYHAIGVNGAQYENYGKENLFCEQVGSLKSNLIIISLGTNEAYGRNFNSTVLYSQISTLVENLKKYSPNSTILLTTPVETLSRKTVRVKKKKVRVANNNTLLVRNTIIKYATDNNMAYWDLYAICGGKNSALQLSKAQLLARDGIHSTKTGYEYQGELLFQAISKSYDEYITSSRNVQN